MIRNRIKSRGLRRKSRGLRRKSRGLRRKSRGLRNSRGLRRKSRNRINKKRGGSGDETYHEVQGQLKKLIDEGSLSPEQSAFINKMKCPQLNGTPEDAEKQAKIHRMFYDRLSPPEKEFLGLTKPPPPPPTSNSTNEAVCDMGDTTDNYWPIHGKKLLSRNTATGVWQRLSNMAAIEEEAKKRKKLKEKLESPIEALMTIEKDHEH
jgi:hypothetical protein